MTDNKLKRMNQNTTQLIPAAPKVESLQQLSREQLMQMHEAGCRIRDSYRLLKKGGLNIVGECLRGYGTFYEMNHYPEGDVYDGETHSQYYYHNHRGILGEHGHFHTFLRASGMQPEMQPVAYNGEVEWPRGANALSHLIAISMDVHGFPIGLFATNRWVTGEAWYAADDVINMLDRFTIDHAKPNLSVNIWISSMFVLFRPQIVALIKQRDIVVDDWRQSHPGVDVFEDRELEVTGELFVSVDEQVKQIEQALA